MNPTLKQTFKPILFLLIFITGIFCIEQSSQEESAPKEIKLSFLTSFSNGEPGKSSAEIVAYDAENKRLFVVNSIGARLDILDFSNLSKIKMTGSVKMNRYVGGINSVAAGKGFVAIAVENSDPQGLGMVLFLDKDGKLINQVQVGHKPDMLAFSPDYKKLLVANEAEPNEEYTNDPEGSVSIIDISKGVHDLKQVNVYTIDFRAYNDSIEVLRKKGVRIFGPNASVAQDLEPEYIAISSDSKYAWVTLQENNAVAKIDIENKKLLDIYAMGEKKLNLRFGSLKSTELCPVSGFYQPDGITTFTANNNIYIVTANEGDIRMYKGFNESRKLSNKECLLDKDKFPEGEKIKDKKNLGKLMTPENSGDADGDGDVDEIYCYGARSFSIWDENMKLIYDSGDDFERISCSEKKYCEFNEKYREMLEEDSWDVRGPEPESVVTGKIGEKIYAFITLERFGGVMVYNITDPYKVKFVQYINSEVQLQKGKSKPEGIIFIHASQSPNQKNLVVVANEGTSTVDVYEVLNR